MLNLIGNSWDEILKDEFEEEYFKNLTEFLKKERASKIIYPPKGEVFTALRLTLPDEVKAVILGQDPYINPGEAHGLAFSVKSSVKLPPSLRNIFQEITADIGGASENTTAAGSTGESSGNLERWARQGVLLLNAVLTVEAGKSNSHSGRGWEKFTDHIIKYLGARENPTVFILWGRNAQNKESLINKDRHLVLKSAHPSPLSAHSGFFGCKHFSQANKFLERQGIATINWQ